METRFVTSGIRRPGDLTRRFEGSYPPVRARSHSSLRVSYDAPKMHALAFSRGDNDGSLRERERERERVLVCSLPFALALFRFATLRRRAYPDWLRRAAPPHACAGFSRRAFEPFESHRRPGHVESRPRSRVGKLLSRDFRDPPRR